uniref:Fibrinogen C-terminal domain-containing protein n=1 Tax=Fundulus heteroclitus TaxID=8078 RepID=A0A3Q2QR42_FUNHE
MPKDIFYYADSILSIMQPVKKKVKTYKEDVCTSFSNSFRNVVQHFLANYHPISPYSCNEIFMILLETFCLCLLGKLRFPFPTECSQELLNGALESGEVNIYPQGKEGRAVRVYCDMETDGGGWTVFQRRMNGKTDFYRTWSEYKAGFGNLSEEFWLGNELLHNLTNIGAVSLRVDLRSGNDTAYARYTNFSVASEERNYTLTVSGYTGTAGDSMRYHNGRPFSTRDKEPDPMGIHCAKAYVGGWWYKNCYKVNLNGLYGMNRDNQGIVWIDWKGKDSSIPFSEMKFRPSRFSPATHG